MKFVSHWRDGLCPVRDDLMETQEFISLLRRSPNKQLLFVNEDDASIHAGYHLTELKAASFDTVDCGGQINQWDETIVQLWVPTQPDAEYMTSAKFLKIVDKVCGMIPLDLEAELRVEYGDENFFPSTYHVRSVTHDQRTTRVLLEPPRTTCKARDRGDEPTHSNMEHETCCGRVAQTCC